MINIKNFQLEKISPIHNLNHIKVHGKVSNMKDSNFINVESHRIYYGPRRDNALLENIYMDTYFHMEKDRLWNLIKEIDRNKDYFVKYGQIPRLNLLLYGPPGTGKSSLAYRVAMCLSRSIVSIDITKYPSKYYMDRLMHGKLGYDDDSALYRDVDTILYVFDEFDRTIKYLKSAEECESKMFEHSVNNMNTNILSALLNSNKPSKSGKLDGNTNTTEDDGDEKQTELEKLQLKPTKNRDILTTRDLLDIFQGVVDIEKRIIFAMSNEYDDIRKICPELFRPGRLTPVYIGYINRVTLIDIIEHYFKVSDVDSITELLDGYHIPDTITLSTSDIIENAIYYNTTDDIRGFVKWISVKLPSSI